MKYILYLKGIVNDILKNTSKNKYSYSFWFIFKTPYQVKDQELLSCWKEIKPILSVKNNYIYFWNVLYDLNHVRNIIFCGGDLSEVSKNGEINLGGDSFFTATFGLMLGL